MRLIIIFILICFSHIGQTQEVSFEAIETKNEIVFLKGTNTPFTGKTVAFFPDGKKSAEVEYKDGHENGTNRMWYHNGNLMNETQIADGKIDGLWIDYFENGQMQNQITYEMDYMNGPCIRWYDNGQVKEKGSHQHCREQGFWVYYFENGQKQSEGNYHQGEKTGLWKEWNAEGAIINTTNY